MFEMENRTVTTPKERVEIELKDLLTKINALTMFMASEKFSEIKEIQRNLLTVQVHQMYAYADTLKNRLKNW